MAEHNVSVARDDRPATSTRQIVVVSAGISQPSSTHLLVEQFVRRVIAFGTQTGQPLKVRQIELRPLAQQIMQAMTSGLQPAELEQAVAQLVAADALVIATPIYKAGMSGLLKSFLDVLDQDILIAKPTALLATAGTARHALVVDEQLRSTMAFFRTLTIPTAVFSTAEDWGDESLADRLDRAATELVALVSSGVTRRITGLAWDRYQHAFGSVSGQARAQTESDPADAGNTDAGADGQWADVDFDSEMMRLAAGGEQ